MSESLELLLVGWLRPPDLVYGDVFLAKRARRVILEPILDAALVKVVLQVAWKCHDALLWLEFAEADAALVLVGQALRTPVNLEHLFEHLRRLTRLGPHLLCPLNSVVEEVGDETGEKDCAENENDGRERSNDQCHVVHEFEHGHWFFSAGWRCLHNSSEVLKSPETECAVIVHRQSERKTKECLIVSR